MAHIRCDFRSEVLDMNTSMTVIVPEQGEREQLPVVYLLHGLADNCSGWSRYTSVERYAREYNVAVVIPEVQRSYYTDMAEGIPYYRFIHDELPELCARMFNLSCKREKSYVMGLSMGGYGAMKCALNTPERYAGCAAFSMPADMPGRVRAAQGTARREFQAIFGESLTVPAEGDLFKLAEKADVKTLPKFYIACGEQDPFCEQNRIFAALLERREAVVKSEYWAGVHDWVFWDAAVCRAFRYMFEDRLQEV